MSGVVGGSVLGIDPGGTAGWGVTSIEKRPRVLDRGVIDASKKSVTPVVLGLRRHKVQLAVIEQQYLDQKKKWNPRTVIRTAQRAGRWEEACMVAGIPLVWIFASEWQARMLKGLVNTWSGKRADRKAACLTLVKMRWGIVVPIDCADALVMSAFKAESLAVRTK